MSEVPGALCFRHLIIFSSSADVMGGNWVGCYGVAGVMGGKVFSSLVMSVVGCGLSLCLLSDTGNSVNVTELI